MGKYAVIMGVILLTTSVLAACSNRPAPAPVISLSTKVASKENLTNITGDSYTVQAGDTLFAIAFYSGNDYRDLAKINKLPQPYTINIGQKLDLVPKRTIAQIAPRQPSSSAVQKTSKIGIDSNPKQAYGIDKEKVRPQPQVSNNQLAIKSVDEVDAQGLTWIWPASGHNRVATVGSDGSSRGLDIKGRYGSKIVASANGKVVYAGNALKGYGNLIIIKHNNEYLSAYAHNQAILVGEQTYVIQGQQIATMGNSGASDTMLHFEIRKKGKSIDPFFYLPPS